MTCFLCKGETKPSTTTHFVDLKDCIVIIKNVPCMECTQCGEKYYTDQVAETLDEIILSLKGLVTEIAIVDYETRVA
ncbi:type II toxin-antitoxin system MqsA family antitoxin [Massiliimalia timonensis]|uniref:type II toxin-antitoxin system MqsA family antitoxin n=1 Tax=Massiliimalia timonensis TaxID=1987501 RepID=UPI0018A021A0|nr:type II toxin-antitoxin system MqsA family antitoxin [Massiliimalia timonensis]